MTNTPKYIIIHCSDVSYKALRDQFNSINIYHRDERGFPKSSLGYYVGYQYLLTGGKKYQARLDTDEGAHTNQVLNGVSMNFQSIGICIGFDGDIEQVPQPEYDLLKKLVREMQIKYSIPDANVKFHREFQPAKTCPGSLITNAWRDTLLEWPPQPVKPPEQQQKQEDILACQEKVSSLQTSVNALIELLRFLKVIK